MKTISRELTEAALVDGASVWRIYWNVILPLCRPALAALATLEFTFIYNDFFWALLLMYDGRQTPDHLGAEQPPGRVLHGHEPARGGRLLAALPTILVYLALQKQFISGLTLGSTKG